jgi:hypothetical protein
MKITIYLAMLLALPLFSIAQTQKTVSITVTGFGRTCSGGLGFCGVSTDTSISNKTIAASNISAYKKDETTLVLVFIKNSLTEKEQRSILGKPFANCSVADNLDFKQEKDLVLNNELLLNLGFKNNAMIVKQGIYPISFSNDKISVYFTLQTY